MFLKAPHENGDRKPGFLIKIHILQGHVPSTSEWAMETIQYVKDYEIWCGRQGKVAITELQTRTRKRLFSHY